MIFVLLCGIIGPIFIVLALVNPEKAGSTSGLVAGIGITIGDVVIGLLVGHFRHRRRLKSHALHQNGRRGQATVLSAEQTTVQVNDQPLVELRVRITAPDMAPFEVERKTVISLIHLPLLHAGRVPVLVDPETREWEFDWDAAPTSVATQTSAAADEQPRSSGSPNSTTCCGAT